MTGGGCVIFIIEGLRDFILKPSHLYLFASEAAISILDSNQD